MEAPHVPSAIVPYVMTVGGNSSVWYVTQEPGQDPTQVSTPTANIILSPLASPDGSMIAWRQAGDLWIVNTDGTGETMIYDDTVGLRINGHDWAKDGSVLLIGLTDAGTVASGYNLSTIEPDGTNLTTLLTDATRRVGQPSYNYDGTKIAFLAYTSGTSREIRQANADGSSPSSVKTGVQGVGVLEDVQPYAVAKTSNQLAYIPAPAGTQNMRVINFNATGDHQVSTDGIDAVWQCWSPDDVSIYYQATLSLTNLRKAAADGSGTSLVYTDASHTHGRMEFVTATRVYRSWAGGGNRGVESVLLDGTGYRDEDGPSGTNAYTMF